MNRKLLALRICSILLLIATLGIFIWEVKRMLATPSQDDILGHAGDFFIAVVLLILILFAQWELYSGLHYFLSDAIRTTEKTVCKLAYAILSGSMLVVSAIVYLFFLSYAHLCFMHIIALVCIIVAIHLLVSISHTSKALRAEDHPGKIAVLIITLICKVLILFPFALMGFAELMQLLTTLSRLL